MPTDLDARLGEPGEYPFTRGVHHEMYRKRLWTMRQYAGYASAKESNERYKYLLANGSTGLSMAFDLPTQLGLDSDDPRCLGEVGRTGVAIDTLDDMRTAFDGIPLDEVSTSMTINAPAAVLLLLYQLVGEEQGVAPEKLRGTVQNDILKEYIARGNFIYPPVPSMRLTTDLFAYCAEHVPRWNTVSISGYHFREKGCSAVQEVAFTLANGMAYVQAAIDAGLEVDRFAPRLAFFFNGHNNVFQEVAKFRAARRIWAEAMKRALRRDRPELDDDPLPHPDRRRDADRPAADQQRRAGRAAGVRGRLRRDAVAAHQRLRRGARAADRAGGQDRAAHAADRRARVGRRRHVDPFAGSYFVEALTDEIEHRARALIAKVDALGGSVEAIAFIKNEIEESAFGYHERYRTGQDIVVGVNKYVEEDAEVEDILRVDPAAERDQLERLHAFKAARDQALAAQRLEALRGACRGRRQPAAPDPRGAQGRLLAGRGLRRDARRLRRVPADDDDPGGDQPLLLRPVPPHRRRVIAWARCSRRGAARHRPRVQATAAASDARGARRASWSSPQG